MAVRTDPLTFGFNIDPGIAPAVELVGLARAAESAGFDLIAIQDHPYNDGFFDTWSLIMYLAAKTERVAFTPNVANLGVRPPAMVAKAAATLGTLEPGRVRLGVGAGATGGGIRGMGGQEHPGGELVRYAEESIGVLRSALAGGIVRHQSELFDIRGYRAGPAPRVPVEVWVGSHKRRMLELTGRAADGWLSGISLVLTPDEVPWRQALIDESARQAGRDPSEVRRIYNVAGVVGGAGGRGFGGSAAEWVDRLTDFVLTLGFNGFVFWPLTDPAGQAAVFGAEVIPEVRERVAQALAAR